MFLPGISTLIFDHLFKGSLLQRFWISSIFIRSMLMTHVALFRDFQQSFHNICVVLVAIWVKGRGIKSSITTHTQTIHVWCVGCQHQLKTMGQLCLLINSHPPSQDSMANISPANSILAHSSLTSSVFIIAQYQDDHHHARPFKMMSIRHSHNTTWNKIMEEYGSAHTTQRLGKGGQ